MLLATTVAQTSTSSTDVPSPLVEQLQKVPLAPPYPTLWDMEIAAYGKMNVSWYLATISHLPGPKTTVHGVFIIEWISTNCSSTSVPIFSYYGQRWNEPCDEGYDMLTTFSAFTQYYSSHGITTPTIQYMYYPHIIADVGVNNNWTTLVVAESATSNHTLAVVPTCGAYFLSGFQNNVLVTATQNEDDDFWTYYYAPINGSDAIYLSSLVNPFVGASCLEDGQLCWSLACDTDLNLRPSLRARK